MSLQDFLFKFISWLLLQFQSTQPPMDFDDSDLQNAAATWSGSERHFPNIRWMADTPEPEEQHKIDIKPDKRELQKEIYSAAVRGNWENVIEMFEQHKGDIAASKRQAVLHKATFEGKIQIVGKLMEMMSKDELETDFCNAVTSGKTGCATIMLKKKSDLATSTLIEYWNGETYLPIEIAAKYRNFSMVRLLYDHMRLGVRNREHNIDFFVTFIRHGFYDIANRMLSANPGLATQVNSKRESALYAIAGDHGRQRIDLTEQLLKQANGRAHLIKGALFRAAREGNSGFLARALRLYPHLANEVDDNDRTLFYVAVQHRHIDAFNVLMEAIDYDTRVVKLMLNRERNKILDLAAKLPKGGPKVVPGGAALQLQHELLLFKEVKKLFKKKRHHVKRRNNSYTQLFDSQHEVLRREGEEWLTRISKSCMSVVVLLITVLVAGLFNVPGGSKQDTGVPNHIGMFWFKTFMISYAATSILSASSILFFLSILTSSFSMNEFLKSLPLKLFLGLVSLFLSMIAMMVTFVAAFFLHFEHFAYPVAALASVLTLLASYLQFPLLVQVFIATFAPTGFRECLDRGFQEMERELEISDSFTPKPPNPITPTP